MEKLKVDDVVQSNLGIFIIVKVHEPIGNAKVRYDIKDINTEDIHQMVDLHNGNWKKFN